MKRPLTLALLALATPVLAGLHPAFVLLDSAGRPVLESGAPYSPDQTCGGCHDVEAIHESSVHGWLGAGLEFTDQERRQARPWERGPAPYDRWDPLLYAPGPAGPEADADWLRRVGPRHVGGGPALALGLEEDCLLCHLASASVEGRREALRLDRPAWAASAALLPTGLLETTAGGWRWRREAFDAQGQWPIDLLPLGDPDDERCGQCHGLVWQERDALSLAGAAGWRRDPAAFIYSPQRVSDSGLNLAGKQGLDRSWDVHAERLLSCTDCHASVDNPARAALPREDSPAHLLADTRGLDPGEFLHSPSHRLVGGWLSGQETDGAGLTCTVCHSAETEHAWLPNTRLHLQALSCEACHIPDLPAGARLQLDWTALDEAGQPLESWRGSAGDPADLRLLQHGARPLLLPQAVDYGRARLQPVLLESVWLWVAGDPPQPVPLEILRRAWQGLEAEPARLAPFDANHDGRAEAAERRLDNPAKVGAIQAQLVAAGLTDARIVAQLRPQPLHHGVTRGTHALRACTDCHHPQGRVTGAYQVAAWVPGEVLPDVVWDGGGLADATLERHADGSLWLKPGRRNGSPYVMGAAGLGTTDHLGLLLTGLVLGGAGLHGGLRWRASRRKERI
ncbi:MAG: hypothetical protein WC326_02295 [Candidatus Delongbacteria bacterium]